MYITFSTFDFWLSIFLPFYALLALRDVLFLGLENGFGPSLPEVPEVGGNLRHPLL